jgi:hypothetical protein
MSCTRNANSCITASRNGQRSTHAEKPARDTRKTPVAAFRWFMLTRPGEAGSKDGIMSQTGGAPTAWVCNRTLRKRLSGMAVPHRTGPAADEEPRKAMYNVACFKNNKGVGEIEIAAVQWQWHRCAAEKARRARWAWAVWAFASPSASVCGKGRRLPCTGLSV